MQVTRIDDVWYKYDDTMVGNGSFMLCVGTTHYYPQHRTEGVITSWLALLPEDAARILHLGAKIIGAEKLSWQEVYEHLWTEQERLGKRYTGIWSGCYDIASWLRTSVDYARKQAVQHTNYAVALMGSLKIHSAHYSCVDSVLYNYVRERLSALEDFLQQTEDA